MESMTSTPPGPRGWRRRGKPRRRIAGAFAVGIGLLSTGGLYTALSPPPQLATAQVQSDTAQVARGEQLYTSALA